MILVPEHGSILETVLFDVERANTGFVFIPDTPLAVFGIRVVLKFCKSVFCPAMMLILSTIKTRSFIFILLGVFGVWD